MILCSYCEQPAVTKVGYGYCREHLSGYETPILEGMLSIDPNPRRQFFMWAFGTIRPTFSMLPQLYRKIPAVERGWNSKERCFTKSQDAYLKECYLHWLERDYPLIQSSMGDDFIEAR